MSRDKQIDAMYDDLVEIFDEEYNRRNLITPQNTAERMTDKGYRKASDVAEEIFAEIDELLNLQAKIVCETRGKYRETDEPMLSFIAQLDGRIYSLRIIEEHLAELKKKYTESEEK